VSRRVVIITEIIAPYRIPVFNALARRPDINLHVIFLAETDPTQRQWLVYKNEIYFSYEVLPSWRRRIGKQCLLLNWGAEAALRQAAPDFIVCGGYSYIASWQAMAWARRNHVPFALWSESTARDRHSGYAWVEALKEKFLRRCDAFVVPGQSSAEYMRTYGAPLRSIFTAPNAVDSAWFARQSKAVRQDAGKHRRALNLPARFFLFAGRLVQEKGIFDLLQAYGSLPIELRNEVGLVFVGDGEERSELRRRAVAVQPGAISVTGFAQRERLAAYYALADALVFPTYTDPWGLVVNEALACGLPVISSSVAGCVADLIEDGWNGRVVAVGDVGRLVFAMTELANNFELRALMGQRSLERSKQFSPEAWALGVANAVLECTAGAA
jgi:glycosyltransferase involved in cell wall biosynthesis